MLFLVGEGAQLVLDRGAVTRSDAVDRAVEERRPVEACTQRGVHFGRSVDQKTGTLMFNWLCISGKRKLRRIFVAVLRLQCLEVDRAGVESCGGTGLHAPRFESHRGERCSDARRSGIAGTSARRVRFAAVHHAVEEGAGREDHGARSELDAHARAHARHGGTLPCRVEEQFCGRILPDIEVLRIFQFVPPFGRKTAFVALRARAPHGRSLRAVEHPELECRAVGDTRRAAAQRVDFADDLPLGYASHGGVARHVGQLGHVHR